MSGHWGNQVRTTTHSCSVAAGDLNSGPQAATTLPPVSQALKSVSLTLFHELIFSYYVGYFKAM